MSFYARSAWVSLPYAPTTRYACGAFGDVPCDSAAEGVAGSQAARTEDWSSVAAGGDMILTATSGNTYSGAASCDPVSYNEGFLGNWQLRCVQAGGAYAETADGYQCHVPAKPTPGPGPTPSPGPAPGPAPAPAPAPPDYTAVSAAPLFIAGALVVGVLIWKVYS